MTSLTRPEIPEVLTRYQPRKTLIVTHSKRLSPPVIPFRRRTFHVEIDPTLEVVEWTGFRILEIVGVFVNPQIRLTPFRLCIPLFSAESRDAELSRVRWVDELGFMVRMEE
jgi:hypothetical protein